MKLEYYPKTIYGELFIYKKTDNSKKYQAISINNNEFKILNINNQTYIEEEKSYFYQGIPKKGIWEKMINNIKTKENLELVLKQLNMYKKTMEKIENKFKE